MSKSTSYLLRFSGIALFLLSLSACGGSSGTGTPDDDDTSVDLAGGDGDGNPADPSTLRTVTENAPINDSVGDDRYNLYKVPSGSHVVVTNTSGNTGLFLYTSLDLEDENLVCSGRTPFRENSCSATVSDGELYALVYGREPSDYKISVTNDCSVAAINSWVDRSMRDYYLYYDQVPSVNPADYTSAQALVDELRFDSLDPYSNIRDQVTQSQFSEQGILKGLGYRWTRDNAGTARVSRVYTDSPFGRAGINRGDIIVSINGVLWDEMTFEKYVELTGTQENPLTANWRFIDNETDNTFDAAITLGEFTANTVLHSQRITHPDYAGTIGYIAFSSFIETSEAELDNVFQDFKANGVTDLVLDLRYNGGGRTSIARQLASQIAGPATDGNLLITYEYNNKYTDLNFSRNFDAEPHNLGLTRLVVLTSGATASSSEIVINSLRPYIEVITIGTRTEGKPYISSSNSFCGKTLNAMEAQGVNASGVGVAGGITADCYATDDVTRDFGVNNGEIEGMLGSAADYLVFGSCESAALAKLQNDDSMSGQASNFGHTNAFINEHSY